MRSCAYVNGVKKKNTSQNGTEVQMTSDWLDTNMFKIRLEKGRKNVKLDMMLNFRSRSKERFMKEERCFKDIKSF